MRVCCGGDGRRIHAVLPDERSVRPGGHVLHGPLCTYTLMDYAKTVLLSHLYIYTYIYIYIDLSINIICDSLPRQARDKRRGNSKSRPFSLPGLLWRERAAARAGQRTVFPPFPLSSIFEFHTMRCFTKTGSRQTWYSKLRV